MLPKNKSYPKFIYYGSARYKVRFVKGLKCYGETCWSRQEIRIKAGMSRYQTFKTLVHEVLHLIEFERPLKIKHRMIYALEEAIAEILLENFL